MGPLSFRKFLKLVKSHGCTMQRTQKEWSVVGRDGKRVTMFAVTHGRFTKSNEVKAVYVRQFLKAIANLKGDAGNG